MFHRKWRDYRLGNNFPDLIVADSDKYHELFKARTLSSRLNHQLLQINLKLESMFVNGLRRSAFIVLLTPFV